MTYEMTVAVGIYFIAQIADVVTTYEALKISKLHEQSKLLRWAMEHLGKNGWILLKLIVAAGAVWTFVEADSIWLVYGIAGLTGIVAVSNYRKIQKYK